MGQHIAHLGHIILIIQSLLLLISATIKLRGEAANTNFIVFGLNQRSTVKANTLYQYTTDALRKKDIWSVICERSELFMVKNVYLGFFDKFNLQSSHTDGYIFFLHIVNTFHVIHTLY